MNNLDLLRMATNNLWRRKTRSFLTILGVVIGTSSIVIMLSLGIAMDVSFKEQLSEMGDLTMIEVYNYGFYDGSMSVNTRDTPRLDDKTVEKINQIPGVKAVMATKRAHFKMGAGRMVGYVSVLGIDPDIMEDFGFEMEEGRLLTSTDKDAIIFGKNVTWDFYNPRLRNSRSYGWDSGSNNVDLMSSNLVLTSDMEYGETRSQRTDMDSNYIPPKLHNVKGVGIIKESFSEKDYNAYMNITALEKIIEEDRRHNREDRRNYNNNEDKYQEIRVKTNDIEDVERVQNIIKEMGFQTFSLIDISESMKEISNTIQAVLGGIGAVSLFVAAIGITNTMIMSIYERTREIGVMKVLGANLVDIRNMFLIEAGIIGFFGGIIGLVLSYIISFGLNKIGGGFMGMGGSRISVIPMTLALGAVVFASFIGIISGYSPARRAMNLSALDAIRTE